ncbi:MAG: prolyl oligopeptidase family serine peptidase [Bryobacterales bacterium]|nr:prolyl oligopeptidase family serine peptidase [Bryobacterales bacterium]
MLWLVLGLLAAAAAGGEPTQIREALFVPNPLPPLAVEHHGTFEPEPGIVAERVSYASAYGMRVPAILYRPARPSRKAPGLIVVNGHGGDKSSWYATYSGVLYARAGAFVLTYDPLGEGERNGRRESGTREHDTLQKPDEIALRLGGTMQTDVMQAVSYLASRPEVDASRIAAAGYSMGSFVLSIACAHETRLRACVLAGGGNLDGPGEYWDTSKQMCQGLPYKALSFLGRRPERIFSLHAGRGPTLIVNGTEDTILQHQRRDPKAYFRLLQRLAAEARGTREGVFETLYEEKAGHRPLFVTRPVALWLERQIDFPDWTAAVIESMPVTHIGSWARDHRVAMDPLYATEHREGGTLALGADIPGIERDRLHVLSREEWERRRGEFVYSGWLKRVRGLQ